MSDVSLQCQCGNIKGTITNATPSSGSLVVCCCEDCQNFIRYLKQEENTLDQFGGTRIYQTSQSQLTIHEGHNQLKSLRLSEKGTLRWYAGCCKTPIGNTISASMPFVGVIHSFIDASDHADKLGSVRAYVQTQHATGQPDYPHSAEKFPIGITLRIVRKMLFWKIRGMHKPTVFFDSDGKPVSKPVIVNESNSNDKTGKDAL